MNYSIILLGATISVSLFIRICGVCSALEVNSHSSRGSDNYENWVLPNYQNEGFDGFRRKLIPHIEQDATLFGKSEEKTHSYLNDPEVPTNRTPCIESFHHYICGEKSTCNETQHSLPEAHHKQRTDVLEGCKYEDAQKTSLICENVSSVPLVNVSLANFEIVQSSFEELPARAFEDVSINVIILRHNLFTKISPYAFENIANVTHLSIVNNELLAYLPYDMYKGLNTLVYLNLDNNNINFEVFDKCKERQLEDIPLVMTSLRYLSFKGNPLKKIPSQMWAGLRESPVTALILSDCSIENISADSFYHLKNLKTLYLDGNRNLNFNTTFEGLRNLTLENLVLANNDFKTVPVDSLAIVAHSLTTLDLSFNNFDRLTSDDFPNMTKLKELAVSNCGIRNIAEGTFKRFPNLISLDLKGNKLYSIPSTVFSLQRLMFLTLDNNAPVESVGNNNPDFVIRSQELRTFPLLTHFSINNTPLKKIKKGMFDGIPSLQSLTIGNAKISLIEDGAFEGTNLKTLFLSDNSLTKLSAKMFDGLENLTYLYLNNNAIDFIPPAIASQDPVEPEHSVDVELQDPNYISPFSGLNKLESLELQNNKIKNVYPELFLGLEILGTLDLSANLIQSWEVPVFTGNYSDTRNRSGNITLKLNFSSNQIKFISDSILEDLVSFAPEVIDLTGNDMICNEGSCGLRNLMNNNSKFGLDLPIFVNWTDVNSYKCIHSITRDIHFIKTITNETCESSGKAVHPEVNKSGSNTSPNKMIIMIVGIVCGTCFIAGLLVTGYKKRIHLGYIFFKVKMNVMEIPRKAKTSVVEESFFYDLFVSYHNQDRSFIIDQFLPEVEDPEVTKNESSDYDVFKHPGQTGFRVCLHERDFEAGVAITENIVESVDKSRKIVIIVSKKYLESQWCLFEMNLAYHRLIEARRTSFVLVFLEQIPNSMRTKVLSYLMRSRTYLEWPGETASPSEKTKFWARLRAALSTSD